MASPDTAFQQSAVNDFRREALAAIAAALLAVGVLLEAYVEMLPSPLASSRLGLQLVVIAGVVLLVAQQWYRASAWVLVVGTQGVNLVASHWHPAGAVLSLLALPTGMAMLLLGTGSGVVAAGLATLLLVIDRNAPAAAGGTHVPALAAIWGTLGLIWVTRRPTLRAMEWAWSSYDEARRLLEGARQQRVELKQTQQDLVHANGELARLSDRLEAMYRVAEDARRAKAEFVANVSHELRTPLNMVIGFCEMITHAPEYYGGLPPKLLADIKAIERNAQHLSNLIDDVLDISQIEANRMALSKEPASLAEIVAAAVGSVANFFESKGLSLETEVPPDLPVLTCDPLRIRQVLLNLLSNAGRFTERGGVRIRVVREEQRLVVSVRDSGPGIPAGLQGKLFEPFEQLDGSLRRRHAGSGLGLSIGKRFVELHGGEMWLESAVGVGTTVSFSLPLAGEAPAALGEGSVARWFSPYHQYEARTRPSMAPAPAPPPRFVVLEKGRALQRLLRRYMGGVELAAVSEQEDARRELSRSPAQALLVNAPWPREAGTPIGWPGSVPYDTPVIACWVPGEDEAAEELGVVDYLVKPVSREALLSSLDALGERVRTVLLVDDEPEALQLYSRMLSSAGRGYRLLRAASGQEAMALLRGRRPDVMLLDLMMPGMDGVELLRQKGQDAGLQPIPVIVVSAREIARLHLMSNTLVAARNGLTVEDLTRCIWALSENLTPSPREPGRARPETPAG